MKNKGILLLIIFAVGIAAVFFLSKGDNIPLKKAAVGLDAPAFELKDSEGKIWRLSDYKGKVIFINFWATWCAVCKEEKPHIQNLINAEKGNERFVFISVLVRDDADAAKRYMKENGFTVPFLIDDRNVAGQYSIRALPETFIIDKKGIIQEKIAGFMKWDSPYIRDIIAKLANE